MLLLWRERLRKGQRERYWAASFIVFICLYSLFKILHDTIIAKLGLG